MSSILSKWVPRYIPQFDVQHSVEVDPALSPFDFPSSCGEMLNQTHIPPPLSSLTTVSFHPPSLRSISYPPLSLFSLQTLSDINRTFAQSGPDDELTGEEFNEALRRSGTDTAPGPDRIRYSDILKLTEEDRDELCTIYHESPKTGQTACRDIFPNQGKTTTS